MKTKHTVKNASRPARNRAKTKKGLTHRGPAPMALEQRFMFDGAAVTDATQIIDAAARTCACA